MEIVIKNILLLFKTVYGDRFELNPASAGIWKSLLNGYSKEELEEAAQQVCKTSPFPPTPADVIKNIKKSRTKNIDILQRTASDIWEGARKKMLTDSHKYDLFLESKTVPKYIKESFEAVGGVTLCYNSDLDRIFPRFEAVFNEKKRHFIEEIENAPKPLLGTKTGGYLLNNSQGMRENDNTKNSD